MNKHDHIDQLFKLAREQKTQASFNETKELFLQSVQGQAVSTSIASKGVLFTLKNKIIMSTIIGITVLIATALFLQKAPEKSPKTTHKTDHATLLKPKKSKPQKTVMPKTTRSVTPKQTHKKVLALVPVLNSNPIDTPKQTVKNVTQVDPTPQLKKATMSIALPIIDDAYNFPKLTSVEIRKTSKQKKKMLKDLAKKDQSVYSYIPSGSFNYQGTTVSVQAFFMQKAEVTNLEYRTFLFDILIQNRKEEFLRAKPDQAMWTKLLGEGSKPMEELYFSHESYDHYPVVNISREGAEMYCRWLTEELHLYLGEKNTKIYHNDMRLPTREEWVKAASVEGFYKNYPWETDSIKSAKGEFMCNFKPSENSYFEDGAFHTAKIQSYAPNGYGIYDLSGNVAEMVYDWSGGYGNFKKQEPQERKPGTAGGGWMNLANEVKINAPDQHPLVSEPHPNIGFRVITTHLGRGAQMK